VPAEIESIETSIYTRIYRCIACIPAGKVATYGQISDLVNASGPRQVGYALSSTPPDLDVPWHRVINAKGEVSLRSDGDGESEHLKRLRLEGVMTNKHARINLSRYRWQPSFDDFQVDDELNEDELWLDRPGFG
jgi:methylated-DNA-protein-cysteine methyltransferase-like protein